MRKRSTSRVTLWICAIQAGLVLWATGLLFVRLRPYWVAKYRGEGADLRGARLMYAPLAGAYLLHAKLQYANLMGANLAEAELYDANLQHACLRAAVLE